VGAQVLPIEIILRAASLLLDLGARLLTGLSGNVVLPRQVTEFSPWTWLSEGDSVTDRDESFQQISLTYHRLSGMTSITRQLRFQTLPEVGEHVADSLVRGAMAALDAVAFQGTGSLGQPTGIFNSPVQTETFSSAATLATVADMETKLAQQNVLDQNICFVGDPLTRAKWRSIARSTNASSYLWNDGAFGVLGHRSYVTTNVPASSVVAFDPMKMVIGIFGEASPVSILVDPYSSKKSEKIEITSSLGADVAVANPNAFVISSGSTTQ
jgi:HK97 family phage major capsid protein